MGKAAIDIVGERFGMLVVLGRAPGQRQAFWSCRCDCGTVRPCRGDHLRDGSQLSCGCARLRTMARSKRRHGHASGETLTPTYRSWMAMRRRCSEEKRHNFANYGGRGIRVCERWAQSFEAFLADMGERPQGLTLDRKDVNGDYEPDNCRWATWSEQARNRRPARRRAK